MTAADPYRPAPLTPEQQADSERVYRDALALVASMYAGHRLTPRQQQQADKAARLARALVRVDQQKRGRS